MKFNSEITIIEVLRGHIVGKVNKANGNTKQIQEGKILESHQGTCGGI